MAETTNPNLENKLIYSTFVRNHSEEGTFKGLEKDLERIRDLGTDIVWLMPIHPCGVKGRKGRDGSPYAIADYRIVNPEFGTLEDLKSLTDKIHELGMECMIDVVYNHTSLDSRLLKEHPSWFYQDENGNPVSLVADWSDIADLDYSNPELQQELVDTLKYWAQYVDGFRCDVASRIPMEFWNEARKEVETVHPGCTWLAESVHLPFLKFCRDQGRIGHSDAELYEAFDVCYQYDVFDDMEAYRKGEIPLSVWMNDLENQESRFPANAIKLRYLENHDQPRFAGENQDFQNWKNWTALMFMMKGMPMIYEGQECRQSRNTDFFTQDVIDSYDTPEAKQASEWIRTLADIKHQFVPAGSSVTYKALDDLDTVLIERPGLMGVFALKETPDQVPVDLPDGSYSNLLDQNEVLVSDGMISGALLPVILQAEEITGTSSLE